MRIGLHLRNMGPEATPGLIQDCARIADELPIDELWVFDHLAIPPDQSSGSGGLYLDAMATLAFVAGVTARIGIGTRLLVLPFRPPLVMAKLVASVQVLSGDRLLLGVGIGALEGEFRALGVARSRRGALADEALMLLHRCFESDEVEINGQPVLFLPRPARPPIFVGGSGPHALRRAVRFGEGWLVPGNPEAARLRGPIEEYRRLARDAGKPEPEVSVSCALSDQDEAAMRDRIAELAAIGVTRIAFRFRYEDAAAFRTCAERVVRAAGR